jgi:hypothetical protein
MAQHVSQLPWHLPMLHPVPAACASRMYKHTNERADPYTRNSSEGPARPRRCADAVARAGVARRACFCARATETVSVWVADNLAMRLCSEGPGLMDKADALAPLCLCRRARETCPRSLA